MAAVVSAIGVGSGTTRTRVADDEPEEEGTGRESHRERSARMRVLSRMAITLIGLGTSELGRIPMSPDLAEAVREGQRFTKNARARQLRRIAGFLRQSEVEPIAEALRELETGRGARSKREQAYERWRNSLLEGGDPAMTSFVAAHPGADVQVLRQHVRNATKDPASPRGKAAARELLRAIRTLGESVSETPEVTATSDEDADDSGDDDSVAEE